MLTLLTLTGCDAFNKVKDTIDGLLDPIVAQGLVLGVEPPDSALIDGLVDTSEMQSGTTVTLFMADARDVQEIENAPITGADVKLSGPGIDEAVAEIDSGTYALTPADAEVPYVAGDTWTLTVSREDSDGTVYTSAAALNLPEDVDFSSQIPEQHTAGDPITLDFSGLTYTSALIVVLDSNGDIAYSNEPDGIREFYDFTHSNETLGTLEIPGSTFADDTVYAVGVAGLNNTDATDLTEMNTALSTVLFGKMNFYPVATGNPLL